jgi:alpha-glucosidase (family GH31 glycosyl hydrolase)
MKAKQFTKHSLLMIFLLLLTSSLLTVCRADEIVGDVRVQVLSATLVRIELKGPKGFEDRPTFHITGRQWPGATVTRSTSGGFEYIRTSDVVVKVPAGADSLESIVITDLSDSVIWSMPSSRGFTLKCRWADHGDAYLYDAGDRVGYDASPADDRFYWITESVNGYTRIKNKATGDYINIENNLSYVECTPVQSHWNSKDWTLEDAGDGYRRLLCRWAENRHYIHIENRQGYAEHAPAGTTNGESTIDRWWSAVRLFEGEAGDLFSNNRYWIPNPNVNTQAWAIADTPRYVPALSDQPWGGGYNVAPQNLPDNGWDLDNDSQDVYVFLPKGDGRQLRSDYITLTGRTDLIPLYALGGWDSRYYPYTQQEALDKIDLYRAKDIPLDVFVVDTDWRVGASHGYGVNLTLFPNMQQFISEAHSRNVRIVFNDHPEPQANVLDYTEVLYRNDGLRSLFDIGLDVWWYDRNWHTAIIPPAGINKEVFGMYLYHWVTQDYYPDRRPFIMANVDGIDNGWLNQAPNIAAHRYNMQWTGDTTHDDASLRREVRNAVHAGVYQPFAYTSTDLGGHMGTPTVEQYCRWVQFGAMSPIFRLHCTAGITRDPWAYADPAEAVVRDYVQMRMRLLPVFYEAARKNYDTGEPILKRCDLNYPGFTEAEDDYQYLIGDDILAAPVLDSSRQAVPSDWLTHGSGSAGLKGEYYSNKTLSGSPAMVRTDANVDFDWAAGNPGGGLPNNSFSVRWTGNISINAGHAVKLGLASDDGCRLWVNGELVIDKWIDQAETVYWSNAVYPDGQNCSIKIEYYEAVGQAVCRLLFEKAGDMIAQRPLWIPPGTWTNVWTGDAVSGPQMHTASVSMTEMPLFVKAGSVIPLAPQMAHTGEKTWDPVTLDVYPAVNQTATGRLYEDDGISNAYRADNYRTTALEASASDSTKALSVTIHPAQGSFAGAPADRSWVIRLHTPAGWPQQPKRVTVDGVNAFFQVLNRDPDAMPFAVAGGSPDSDVIQIQVPSASVTQARTVVVDYYSPADYNQDGKVDISDFRIMMNTWLKQPDDPGYDSRANLDNDPSGRVNLSDCAVFLSEWTG